jgi:type IV pilus assembly PilN-like protein
MRAVNLLPLDLRTRKSIRQEDPAVVVGSALGVMVMIALGAAFYSAHSKAAAQEKRLTAARIELAQVSAKHHATTPKPTKPAEPITPIVPPPSITGEEATWLSSVSTNLSQRIAWDRVLREVSLVMPDDVTLTSLTMTAPTIAAAIPGVTTGAPTGPSQGFVIAGTAFSYDSVARLLSRLALVPDLSAVTLTSTGSGSAAGSSTGGSSAAAASGVQFNISAAVKGPPAPAAPVTTPPVDTSSTTTGVSS